MKKCQKNARESAGILALQCGNPAAFRAGICHFQTIPAPAPAPAMRELWEREPKFCRNSRMTSLAPCTNHNRRIIICPCEGHPEYEKFDFVHNGFDPVRNGFDPELSCQAGRLADTAPFDLVRTPFFPQNYGLFFQPLAITQPHNVYDQCLEWIRPGAHL